MTGMLRCVSGYGMGMEIALDPGSRVSVGRSDACSLAFPGDSFLSGRHFEIEVSESQLVLRDLDSRNGTFLGGTRVREFVLQGGETIQAGGSAFRVQVSQPTVPNVVDVLSSQPDPLYAVLDTARDPAIYPLMVGSGAQYVTLYAGESARTLEAVAPYLVHLPPHCDLLKQLVAQGWSKSWGIFLTSAQPPQTIRHELRRSLMVTLETTQNMVYFRFYDPRVLRVFLPVADPRQRQDFAGSIASFLVEDEVPDKLIRFAFSQGVCHMDKGAVQAGA